MRKVCPLCYHCLHGKYRYRYPFGEYESLFYWHSYTVNISVSIIEVFKRNVRSVHYTRNVTRTLFAGGARMHTIDVLCKYVEIILDIRLYVE